MTIRQTEEIKTFVDKTLNIGLYVAFVIGFIVVIALSLRLALC